MTRVKLEVEAVTPVFIAGADQRNIKNEGLRPSSLRGLLRWWFRAITGGMVFTRNLRELENNVFGSTEQKSAVKVITITNSQLTSIDVPNELRYLWFSMHMQKRRNQRLLWYPKGSKFEIVLHSNSETTLKVASGCLWALIYLGGVGSRMRRGGGSLKVINSNNTGHIPYEFIFNGTTPEDAKNFIEENLKKIFEIFREYVGGKYLSQNLPTFAVLSKKHAKISLLNKTYDAFERALQDTSEIYRNFRTRKGVERRFHYGLPIIAPHKRRRLENEIDKRELVQLRKMKEDELIKEIRRLKSTENLGRSDKVRLNLMELLLLGKLRHSSPLFIGVMDLNGKFTVRLVKFYTSIHPKYSSKLRFLQRDLDGLDAEVNEIMVEIPGVIWNG